MGQAIIFHLLLRTSSWRLLITVLQIGYQCGGTLTELIEPQLNPH